MRLIEQLASETQEYHEAADADAIRLLGPVTAAQYREFLVHTWGFVAPLEQRLVSTTSLDRVIDMRRFAKHELLRRDLQGFHMAAIEIEQLPICPLPVFESHEIALGWAFVVERSTLLHGHLFRHLASEMPGDVAFTSTYLKCYFGAIGESWRSFGEALERVAPTPLHRLRVIEAARAAFRMHRTWRRVSAEREPRQRHGEISSTPIMPPS
jgi:heme oxygenase